MNLNQVLDIISMDIKLITEYLHHYPITKNVDYFYGDKLGSVAQLKWLKDEKRIVLYDPDRDIDTDLRQASAHLRIEVFPYLVAFIEACKKEMEEDFSYVKMLDAHFEIKKLIGDYTCTANR